MTQFNSYRFLTRFQKNALNPLSLNRKFSQKVLTGKTISPRVLQAEYAVRGEIVIR